MKYKLKIARTEYGYIEVEADNVQKAYTKGRKEFDNKIFVVESSDFKSTGIEEVLEKKTYFHRHDGHTYWLEDAKLKSSPTMKDGSLQIDCVFDVETEYETPLNKHEKEFILSKLK